MDGSSHAYQDPGGFAATISSDIEAHLQSLPTE